MGNGDFDDMPPIRQWNTLRVPRTLHLGLKPRQAGLYPRRWLLVVSIALGLAVTNQALPQDALLEAEQQAFQAAVEFAKPSVVQLESFGGADVVAGESVPIGAATGTVLEAGWIVTSTFHFRNQPAAITVVLSDGTRLPATLVARDFNRELALLKLEGNWESYADQLRPAIVSPSQDWQIGEWALALGRTFDPARVSRSIGILSARGRIFDKAIQTDAKVSPYNYGGPLIDLRGRVMGILTILNPGIATEGEAAQWYDGGVGFAIPIQDILARFAKWKEGQDIYAGKIGIRARSTNDYKIGVTLAGVAPGSPAAKAGLKSGDVLQTIDAKPVQRLIDMRHILGPHDAGDVVSVEVLRDQQPVQVDCTLVKEIPSYREPYLGILPSLVASEETIAIGQVMADSPAAQAGLHAGDVLLSLNQQPIGNWKEFAEKLQFIDYRDPLPLSIRDGKGETKSLMIQPKAWPREIPSDLPVLPFDQTSQPPQDVVRDIPLGDVTNKAIALVPPNYRQSLKYGLMIVLPEGNDLTSKPWEDAWGDFCRDHRWIVAVITPPQSQQWSIQDLEVLQKVKTQILNDYSIDRRRIVMGGMGTGGALGMLHGLQNREQIRGVWTIESRTPPVNRIPPSEPQESLHFLMIGSRPEMPKFGEAAIKLGYAFSSLSQKVDLQQPLPANVLAPMQRWLRCLEAY